LELNTKAKKKRIDNIFGLKILSQEIEYTFIQLTRQAKQKTL